MPTLIKSVNVLARKVYFDNLEMHVQLSDGRKISTPLEWFPKLRNATKKQKENWRLIGSGVGIHWNDIDEDISAEGLLK